MESNAKDTGALQETADVAGSTPVRSTYCRHVWGGWACGVTCDYRYCSKCGERREIVKLQHA